MRVLMTGATGFIGEALAVELLKRDHELVVFTRSTHSLASRFPLPCQAWQWEPGQGQPPLEAYRGVDIIINLAGESIAQRWSSRVKQSIYDSRIQTTKQLLQGALEAEKQGLCRIKKIISASAVGYYGDRGDEPLDEAKEVGADYLAEVCRDWEKEASSSTIATLCLRFGLVLGVGGGLLHQMLPAVRAGLAGPLGDGKQYMSWIHLQDLLAIICQAIDQPWVGVANAVAPEPERNHEFTSQLAQHMGRSSFFPLPLWVLRLGLGEAAEFVTASQRAIPQQLTEWGYEFQYSSLEQALNSLVPTDPYEYWFHDVTWVEGDTKKVFCFFSDENNLESITPSWLNFRVLNKEGERLEKGTKIRYRLKLYGIPMKWTSLIDSWAPEKSFSDTQVRGPYTLWRHQHTFQAVQQGTLVKDFVRYRLPLKFFGLALAEVKVNSDVRKIFAYRRQALRGEFGASKDSN